MIRRLVWWRTQQQVRVLRNRLHGTRVGRWVGLRIGHPYAMSGVIVGKDLARLIDILTGHIPDYSKPARRRRFRR